MVTVGEHYGTFVIYDIENIFNYWVWSVCGL